MEESTITSLFASGYETKPALSVPIHVVELTNVPQELRATANVAQQQQATKSIPTEKKSPDKWVCLQSYDSIQGRLNSNKDPRSKQCTEAPTYNNTHRNKTKCR
jgi:hypothetical protein